MQILHQPLQRRGLVILASGIVIILCVYLSQYFSVGGITEGRNIVLTENQSELFDSIALPTFIFMLAGIVVSIFGFRVMLVSWTKGASMQQRSPHLAFLIAQVLNRGKIRNLFWVSCIGYLILFLFTSNTLVYRPELLFSRAYGVEIPSTHVIGCCGDPGSFPVISIYLSEHFGIMLIPTNILLLALLPALVGINFALASNISARESTISCKQRSSKFAGIVGMSAGLFGGCPACASNLLMSLTGMGATFGGVASTTLAHYQPMFILVSLVTLLVLPLIMTRPR